MFPVKGFDEKRKTSKKIVFTAVLAASLTAGKFILSHIPNVEVITFFIVMYSVVFGIGVSLPAVLIFCAVEGFLYGLQYYLVTYFVYWPLLALFAYLISKKTQKFWIFSIYAVMMTIFFGLLSTFIDTLFLTNGFSTRFFVIRYFNGIIFYITQIVCNAVLFPTAFDPVKKILTRLPSN
ncbi:MAG: hypothetical protein LBQ27_01905 [Clostridiales bacterium]|jgi:hypothetical protein|nr:hypothetical protein [Clostridiales bacterium]